MSKSLRRLAPCLLVLAWPAAALAHVTATPNQAPANSSTVIAFRIGHGCDGVDTTSLKVEIPPEIASAKPAAKAGWTINVTHAGDASSPVTAITWTGRLADSQYDDLPVLVKLPAKPGVVYFPTVQTCGKTQVQWNEVPGKPGESLTHPAPAVTVGAPGPAPVAKPDDMAGMAM